jgi:hypothetical protein
MINNALTADNYSAKPMRVQEYLYIDERGYFAGNQFPTKDA